MKKIFFLIFLFIFNFDVLFCSYPKNDDYFISNLRNKKIAGSEIKIEKLVDERKLYKSYIVSYNVDGLKEYALLNIPKTKMPAKGFPVIVVNHGYIPPNVYSTINSYRLITTYYANNGFIAIKPDYRGHDKSESKSDTPYDRLDYVIDVLVLLNSISSIKEADTDNIFVYGHSMGGDVTLRLIEITDKIKGATLWAPVSESFPENNLYFIRKRDKQTAEKLKNLIENTFDKSDYPKLSAISNTQYIKIPLIIHHGTVDESVPYDWSLNLIKVLNENKINYKFYSYKDDHNFSTKYFYTVLAKDIEFFKSLIK